MVRLKTICEHLNEQIVGVFTILPYTIQQIYKILGSEVSLGGSLGFENMRV